LVNNNKKNFDNIKMHGMYVKSTACVNNSFTFFKSAYYVWFLFITDCILPIFHLDCNRWCRFMFLAPVGNKSHCRRRGNYM